MEDGIPWKTLSLTRKTYEEILFKVHNTGGEAVAKPRSDPIDQGFKCNLESHKVMAWSYKTKLT